MQKTPQKLSRTYWESMHLYMRNKNWKSMLQKTGSPTPQWNGKNPVTAAQTQEAGSPPQSVHRCTHFCSCCWRMSNSLVPECIDSVEDRLPEELLTCPITHQNNESVSGYTAVSQWRERSPGFVSPTSRLRAPKALLSVLSSSRHARLPPLPTSRLWGIDGLAQLHLCTWPIHSY